MGKKMETSSIQKRHFFCTFTSTKQDKNKTQTILLKTQNRTKGREIVKTLGFHKLHNFHWKKRSISYQYKTSIWTTSRKTRKIKNHPKSHLFPKHRRIVEFRKKHLDSFDLLSSSLPRLHTNITRIRSSPQTWSTRFDRRYDRHERDIAIGSKSIEEAWNLHRRSFGMPRISEKHGLSCRFAGGFGDGFCRGRVFERSGEGNTTKP